jgi:TBCC domain-containing protein 1
MARLWIRSEPFINGAINYPITNHINANTLRKTLNYAKNKGPAGYPKIEYSIWKYIACNKINIPEHIAWMYFETFLLVSNMSAEKRIEFDQEILNCKTNDEIDRKKETRKVDLLQFVLLLYIQQYYSVDIKSSFMSREE